MIFLLYPTQLFDKNPYLDDQKIYLIEDPIYFTKFKFHKLKLAYHRATMKLYHDQLKDNGFDVKYIEFKEAKEFYRKIKGREVEFINPVDHDLMGKLKKVSKKLLIHPTLNFLNTLEELEEFREKNVKDGKYRHDTFYRWQRKKLDVFLTKNGKPLKGKWSFDVKNREKFPDNIKVPDPTVRTGYGNKEYIKEAKKYVEKHFPKNYGSLDNFIYPIDSQTSLKWLRKFLKKRLEKFGPYQDAVDPEIPFGFHSVISPMLNIGLLTDKVVLEETQKYLNKVPYQSIEGFVRQLIGWRNYCYMLYLFEHKELEKENLFNHRRRIGKIWWEAETGLEPIDDIIKKIQDYSYAHHIERLMYLGNILMLLEKYPGEVFRIFMEWTIDAYDWVMVPNIYGMSQHSAGQIMMTRPYFSSSNYIRKMSTYGKGEWADIWDTLYYYFIHNNQKYLEKNYSTAMQVRHWKNKSAKEKKRIISEGKKLVKQF